MTEATYEICPCCGEEVILYNPKLKTRQPCPLCQEMILPCSLCDAQDMKKCSSCDSLNKKQTANT